MRCILFLSVKFIRITAWMITSLPSKRVGRRKKREILIEGIICDELGLARERLTVLTLIINL